MPGKEMSDSGKPSAPPEGNSSDIIGQNISPAQYQQPLQHVPLGSQSPVSYGMASHSEPPPSYQAAMAYPATSGPYATNSNDTTFPKPHGTVPPHPSQSVPNQMFPPTSRVSGSSQPPPVPVRHTRHCTYCGVGAIAGQTDLCCLICLVLLALFTFPLGLLLLCFIPCTVHKRCSQCHRMG